MYIAEHPTLPGGLVLFYPCYSGINDDAWDNKLHGYRHTRYNLSYYEYNDTNNPASVAAPTPSGRAYVEDVIAPGWASEFSMPPSDLLAVDNITLASWVFDGTSDNQGIILLNHYGCNLVFAANVGTRPLRSRFNGESFGATWANPLFQSGFRGSWHHYILTYNGTSLTTYIDGSVVDSHLVTGPMRKDATVRTTINGYVGASGPAMWADYGVWNRALSPSECSDLYSSQGLRDLTLPDVRMKRYWSFPVAGGSYLNLTAANGSGDYNPVDSFTLMAGVALVGYAPGLKQTIISKISALEGGYELYIDNLTLKFRVYKSSTVYTEVSKEIELAAAGSSPLLLYGKFKSGGPSASGAGSVSVGYLGKGGGGMSKRSIGHVISTSADFKVGAGVIGGYFRGVMYWASYIPRLADAELNGCVSGLSDYSFSPTVNSNTGVNGRPYYDPIWEESCYNPARTNPSMHIAFAAPPVATHTTVLPVESPKIFDVVNYGSFGTPGEASNPIAPNTQYWNFPQGGTPHLSIPSAASLIPSGDFSIVWCGMIEGSVGAYPNYTGLVSKWASGKLAYRLVYGNDTLNGHATAAIFGTSSNGTSVTNLELGKAPQQRINSLITATYKYNGAGNINTGTLYFNDNYFVTSSTMAGPIYSGDAAFRIGHNGLDATATYMFHGRLFYAAFLSSVVTEAQHRALLNRELLIEDLSPVLLFRADKHPAATVTTEVGGYTATVVNYPGSVTLNGIADTTPNRLRGLSNVQRFRKTPY